MKKDDLEILRGVYGWLNWFYQNWRTYHFNLVQREYQDMCIWYPQQLVLHENENENERGNFDISGSAKERRQQRGDFGQKRSLQSGGRVMVNAQQPSELQLMYMISIIMNFITKLGLRYPERVGVNDVRKCLTRAILTHYLNYQP